MRGLHIGQLDRGAVGFEHVIDRFQAILLNPVWAAVGVGDDELQGVVVPAINAFDRFLQQVEGILAPKRRQLDFVGRRG